MPSELKPYPAYRHSGADWLGALPAHWKVRRLRSVAEMRVSNVDKHTRNGERPVRLCNYVDVYANDKIDDLLPFMEATASPDEIARFKLRRGDVLITKDSETWNDIGVPARVESAPANTLCGYHLALLRPFSHCESYFLFRALQSPPVANQFHVSANGVTRYGLTHGAIKSILLPVPSRTEQVGISRFLNYADRRIQRYISAKEKLIALLEEQKRAVINEAVTGRIDVRTGRPYAAYRESGVGWLGMVPAHWDIRRIKNWLGTNESVLPEDTEARYRFDYLDIGTVGSDQLAAKPRTIFFGSAPSRARRVVRCGDTIVSTVRPYLKTVWHAEHTGTALIASTGFAVLTPRDGTCAKFVSCLCLSDNFTERLSAESLGTAYPAISEDALATFHVCVPPLREQAAIACFVDRTTHRISAAVASGRRQIELLREYRASLIETVVTGKVDVREAAARLPESDSCDDFLETGGRAAGGGGAAAQGVITGDALAQDGTAG